MSANSVRPWTRIIIAARDKGICAICGKPIDEIGSTRKIKAGRIPTLPQGGSVLKGERYATIDHVYPQLGKTSGEVTIDGYVYYRNLALSHVSCNTAKTDQQPNDREIAQSMKAITPATVYRAEQALKELGHNPSSIRSNRADGRMAFRHVAAYLGALSDIPTKVNKKKKKAADDDEIPF